MATKTFGVSACLPVNLSGEANPGDLHLPIGRWAPGTGLSWQTRVLVKASLSFAGMASINEARLYLYAHTAAGHHAKGSGSNGLEVRRKVADWAEASAGEPTGTDESWGGSAAALVTGGFSDDGDGGSVNSDTGDGSLVYVPITNAVRQWLDGAAPYGLLLLAADESSSSNAFEAYSRRSSGRVPYLWIDYSTNTQPNAPVGRAPGNGDTIHTGRTITYSATRSDPDAGDYISAYEIEVYTDGRGSRIQTYETATSGQPTSFARALTLPSGANAGGPVYEWRTRTRDRELVWSPWSGYARYRPNSAPNAPPVPQVDADSRTPTIRGSFSDPDPSGPGASIAAVEIEVAINAPPQPLVWSSGYQAKSSSPWSHVYAGPPLDWGTVYRARYRVQDGLAGWSGWGAWISFRPVQPLGPDNLQPRSTAAKLNTLTPTLTIGHSSAFRNHELEVYAGSSLASSRLWSVPWAGADYAAVTSKATVYAGAALAWGGIYYWRARIEDAAGAIGSWSELVPFRINALPTAPTLSVASDAGVPAALSPAGVLVTSDTTPLLAAPFVDPDRASDGDLGSARSIEVRRKDTGAALAGYPLTSGTEETHTLATALPLDVIHQARWGWRDNAGQPAGAYVYSAWTDLKASAAPTLALVAPPAAAVVTDQTPLLDWSYASAAGKLQATHRVRIFDVGAQGTAPPYADAMLASVPRAWYRLGEASGAAANDASGNALHATYTAAPLLGVPGLLTREDDTAAQFGVGQNVQGPALGVTGAHSAFLWFRRIANPASGTQHGLIRSASGHANAAMYISAAGTQLVVELIDAAAATRSVIVAAPAGDNARHLLGYVFSGSHIQPYIDGIAAGPGVACTGLSTGANGIRLGATPGSGVFQINAVLDEAALWTRALDAAEIAALYASGTDPRPAEQVVHDSGVRSGAQTAYDVPPGVLLDAHEYRWQVDVTDTDGLSAGLP